MILRSLLIVATPHHKLNESSNNIRSMHIRPHFAEYCLFYRALLQKRPIILRSLLIVANPCHKINESSNNIRFMHIHTHFVPTYSIHTHFVPTYSFSFFSSRILFFIYAYPHILCTLSPPQPHPSQNHQATEKHTIKLLILSFPLLFIFCSVSLSLIRIHEHFGISRQKKRLRWGQVLHVLQRVLQCELQCVLQCVWAGRNSEKLFRWNRTLSSMSVFFVCVCVAVSCRVLLTRLKHMSSKGLVDSTTCVAVSCSVLLTRLV